MYFAQRRLPEAIKYYDKAAELTDTDFSSVNLLMTCYKALGYVVWSLCTLGEADARLGLPQ